MSEAVRRLAQSEWLTAMNRVLIMVMGAIGFPLLIWVVSTVVTHDRYVAVLMMESQRHNEVLRDLVKGREDGQMVANRALVDLSALREQMAGVQRSMGRLEAFIDRTNQPPR